MCVCVGVNVDECMGGWAGGGECGWHYWESKVKVKENERIKKEAE